MQYRAGRFCAGEALRQLDAVRWGDSSVGRSPRGAPVWPTGVVGSITHTDGFASAAVARRDQLRGLGIDAEGIVSLEQQRNVSHLVSWPSELAHAAEAGLDRQQSLTLVFSAKEAVFKCLYPLIGSMFYYHDVRIVGVDAGVRSFRARIARTLSPEFQVDTLMDGWFDVTGSLVFTGLALPVS